MNSPQSLIQNTAICSQRLGTFKLFERLLSKKSKVQLDEGLDELYQQQGFNTEQKAFTTHLAYSLCRYWFSLDDIIKTLSHKKPKLERKVEILLKMGLLSLSNIISIPDYAAINEVLKLAKAQKISPQAVKYLHGLLQAGKQLPQLKTLKAKLPNWLEENLKQTPDMLAKLADQLQNPPKGFGIRINTLKTTVNHFIESLNTLEISFEPNTENPDWLYITENQLSDSLTGYLQGLYTPQTQNAFEFSLFCQVLPNSQVLEIGAAPGGKTSHLAALMANTGQITAVDISENRIERLKANLNRLGVTNTTVINCDITQAALPQSHVLFDFIIIDAPCSASGILHRHPDVMLQLSPQSIEANQAKQLALLNSAYPLLKTGGTLIYATCSLLETENEGVLNQFCFQNAITPSTVTLKKWGPSAQGDGFFAFKVIK